jgi:hypothetical protein
MIPVLPFALTLGLDTATPAPAPSPGGALQTIAPGTYTYKSAINGQSVGSSTIVVKQNGAVTEIDEQTAGTINGVQASAKATLNLAADLSPSAYQGEYQGGGQAAKTTVTFTETAANAVTPAGPKSFPLLGTANHFIVLDGALLSGFVALPAEMRAWNNATVTAIAPVYGQSLSLAPDPSVKPNRPATVPGADLAVSVSGQIPFTVWYDPSTNIADELDVPSQGIVVTRVKS